VPDLPLEASDHDSEDSNRESQDANDYPEERSSFDEDYNHNDDDDEEIDEEMAANRYNARKQKHLKNVHLESMLGKKQKAYVEDEY
jgi:hypothetical protein